MDDLFNGINPMPAIPPVAAVADNTAIVGAWIDRSGYDSLTYLLITGTDTDTDATFAVTIEHADLDDHSDTAACAATDLLGTTALAGYTFADDAKTRKLGYVGGKKWTRVTVTPAANTGTAFVAAIALLGDPDIGPTPNPPA
jgi:hypothetical protein